MERWRSAALLPAAGQILEDQAALSVMTLAAVAGCAVALGALGEKLNPVVKPLMEAVKKERNPLLQSLASRRLAKLLEICSAQQQQQQAQSPAPSNPTDKVIKNLVNFVSADPSQTPPLAAAARDNSRIVTLTMREAQSAAANNSRSKGGSAAAAAAAAYQKPAAKEEHSNRQKPSAPAAVNATNPTNSVASDPALSYNASSSSSSSSSSATAVQIQTRGAKTALETMARHFGDGVFRRLPKLWEVTLGAVAAVGTPSAKPPGELVYCLRAMQVPILID